MRLTFLYHPHTYEVTPDAQLGLGMLSLATYAKELGADVRVINSQGHRNIDGVMSNLPECDWLMLYGCYVDAPIINRFIERYDNCIIGGPIAKSPDVLNKNYVALIDGPGEDFIKQLVKGIISNIPFYRYHLQCEKLEKDINEYPFPDRRLIIGGFGSNIFLRTRCNVSSTILTSRGCRYNCAFCSSGNDRMFQDYDLGRIEREIESCLSLGIRHLRISDDNLGQDRERLSELCRIMKDAKIIWRASIRTSRNPIEMYEEMKYSGCEELSFGIESGDQDVLNLLRKGTTISTNTESVKRAKQAGIFVRALMMMGTPGESRETLKRNIDWVRKAKPDVVSLKIFVPYPGTAIYDNPDKFKCELLPIIDANNSAYRPDDSEVTANIRTEDLNQWELTSQFNTMKDFLEMEGRENRG